MEQILEDIKKLDVDYSTLKKVFEQFEGTRQIIQYANKKYTFSLAKTIKPVVRCFGVTNRCDDGQFIFFADYDKIYKSLMLQNLDLLLKKFPNKFDNFYIVQTGAEETTKNGDIVGSYHVINFVKNSKSFIKKCVDDLTDCDECFKEIPKKTAHKTHVLRFSKKYYEVDGSIIKEEPKFLHIYPKDKFHITGKECSKPHYLLFQNMWGNPTQISHCFDDLHGSEYHSYLTPNKEDDRKRVCPECSHDNLDYTGVENYFCCKKCGKTWGF